MNTNFKVIGLTRLRINSESTAPEADAFITGDKAITKSFESLLAVRHYLVLVKFVV